MIVAPACAVTKHWRTAWREQTWVWIWDEQRVSRPLMFLIDVPKDYIRSQQLVACELGLACKEILVSAVIGGGRNGNWVARSGPPSARAALFWPAVAERTPTPGLCGLPYKELMKITSKRGAVGGKQSACPLFNSDEKAFWSLISPVIPSPTWKCTNSFFLEQNLISSHSFYPKVETSTRLILHNPSPILHFLLTSVAAWVRTEKYLIILH